MSFGNFEFGKFEKSILINKIILFKKNNNEYFLIRNLLIYKEMLTFFELLPEKVIFIFFLLSQD